MLHVTDPHLFADRDGNFRGTATYTSLRRVLAHIAASDWSPDLVALTGDLIQDDSREAYDNLVPLFEAMQLPVLCVPGNHDIRELMRDALTPPTFAYCGEIEHANWLVIGIDSCVSNGAGGRVSADEQSRLREQIASSAAEHVLVCLHHPPVSVGSVWLDSVGLDNGAAFLQALVDAGKVRAAIFGHVHQAVQASHEAIDIIGTPSTCRQFAVGSDDFALDDNPPAYRQISLHADGRVESNLIWVAE